MRDGVLLQPIIYLLNRKAVEIVSDGKTQYDAVTGR